MRVLVKEKLSANKYKTPEGYLVCVDAILARTGKQEYRKNELYVDSDDDSIVEVDRPYEEVFSEKTISSFENKPFVNEHPDEDVNVHNHRDYAVGFVRDVHEGRIDGKPVLLGNIIVTDEETIAEIESGEKTELSCGYDCDIIDDENPCQRNIRGNHVALCKAGRAGIARIQDSKVEDAKWYAVYGEESGWMKEFKTLSEAKNFIKKVKRFDKEEGIEDEYYIEVEVHDSIKGGECDMKDSFTNYKGYKIEQLQKLSDKTYVYQFGTSDGDVLTFKSLEEAKKYIDKNLMNDSVEDANMEDEYVGLSVSQWERVYWISKKINRPMNQLINEIEKNVDSGKYKNEEEYIKKLEKDYKMNDSEELVKDAKKYVVYVNGHKQYDKFKTKEEAERWVEREKRHDEWEFQHDKYKRVDIKYEIKLEDSEELVEDEYVKDSYIAYDIFSKSYAMESDRAELTTIEKYAKKFNSESEAIRYMNKYFKISRKDIIVKKVNDSISNSKQNPLKYINIVKQVKKTKDSNLGKSKLNVGQKVHLDPTKNSRASKEALEATYEVVGFWYEGKLVTQDPVTKQEYLDMSGVLIKNVSNGVKSSVNRFQLMDSEVKDDDYVIYSAPKGVSTKRYDEVVNILSSYGKVSKTIQGNFDKLTLTSDIVKLDKAARELVSKNLVGKLRTGQIVIRPDIKPKDSKIKDEYYIVACESESGKDEWFNEQGKPDVFKKAKKFKTYQEADSWRRRKGEGSVQKINDSKVKDMTYPKNDSIVYIYTKDGKRRKGMFFMNGSTPTFASYGSVIKLEDIIRWEYV